MSWVEPSTVTTGTLISAAHWNQDIVDNVAHLGDDHNHFNDLGAGGGGALPFGALGGRPSCLLYNSSNPSISANSDVAVAFNSERFDTDTMHDNSSNNSRITCKTAGIYWVWGNPIWAATAENAQGFRAWLRRNGSGAWAASPSVADGKWGDPATLQPPVFVVGELVRLAVNDYMELMVRHQSDSSARTLITNVASPWGVFGAQFVAP